MRFLNSPNFSLFCCAVNVAFGIHAAMAQNWIIFGVCSVFAALCFNNYRSTR